MVAALYHQALRSSVYQVSKDICSRATDSAASCFATALHMGSLSCCQAKYWDDAGNAFCSIILQIAGAVVGNVWQVYLQEPAPVSVPVLTGASQI